MNVFADDSIFPYIEGHMLRGRRAVKLIHRVLKEAIHEPGSNRKKEKLVLYFHGTGKGLILNKTNIRRLAEMFGPETNNWPGNPVELYAEEVDAFGETHTAVRIADRVPKELPADVRQFMQPVSDEEAGEIFGPTPDSI